MPSPLFERFEAKLESHGGQLVRAAVELAKDWRTDCALRRLDPLGRGQCRSLSHYYWQRRCDSARAGFNRHWLRWLLCALRRPRPVQQHRYGGARHSGKASIAGDICVYTNHNFTIEELEY